MSDWKITLAQLRRLRNQARLASDAARERLCDRALAGDRDALESCAGLWAYENPPLRLRVLAENDDEVDCRRTSFYVEHGGKRHLLAFGALRADAAELQARADALFGEGVILEFGEVPEVSA